MPLATHGYFKMVPDSRHNEWVTMERLAVNIILWINFVPNTPIFGSALSHVYR